MLEVLGEGLTIKALLRAVPDLLPNGILIFYILLELLKAQNVTIKMNYASSSSDNDAVSSSVIANLAKPGYDK